MRKGQKKTEMIEESQVWQKLGLVFSPDQGPQWMKSHAQVPTPLICDDFVRVYFATRPEPTISLTSFVDLDINDLTKVVYIHPEPILELGNPGAFDEHGIMPSCAVREGNKVYLYYSGWQRGTTVPYTNSTGLAVSKDGGRTFQKVSEGPILTKNLYDPYSATSPCVLHDHKKWHMWYCSGVNWIKVVNKYEHTYDVKYAHSKDGILWNPTGESSIVQTSSEEAITRPWVLNVNGLKKMWFCTRGSRNFREGSEAYSIGYAQYINDTWIRQNQKIKNYETEQNWDSNTMAYPALYFANDNLIMLYNGNNFGKDGFGAAMLL